MDLGTSDLKNYYLLMRKYSLIDDFYLEQALKTSHLNMNLDSIRKASYTKPADESSLAEFFESSKRSCILDNWRNYLTKLKAKKKRLSNTKVKKALKSEGLSLKLKSDVLVSIRKLVKLKYQKTEFKSLTSYLKTKRTLRKKYPIDPSDGLSDFVIEKIKKIKRSKRNIFFTRYNAKAIEKMSDVMTRLIEHVESPKMQLNVFSDETTVLRSIDLLPMDRFRFAIRYLRKEMNELQLDVDFKGAIPSYDDIIVAAYETNIVAPSELAELASMEEIWNPEQTGWQKTAVWIRMFLPIATVLIPPPYNVIASIAMIIIELTTKKDEPGYNHALFPGI
jgi:hypothetical protein